jgi:hypothetical protein
MVSIDNITTEELYRALEKLEQMNVKNTLSNFSEYTEYNSGHIYHYYDSWNDFLLENNLEPNRRKVSNGDLLEALNDLEQKLGKTPTSKDMCERGKYHSSLYEKHFNSWNNAIEEAGMEVNKCENFSKEDVVEYMKDINGKPKVEDLDEVPFSIQLVYKYFPSWNDMLLEIGYEARKHEDFVCSGKGHWKYKEEWNDDYGSSWNQQRLKALKRDSFQCRVCESEKRIHVHHIKPVRKWDVEKEHKKMNNLRNLICLCQSCHNRLEGRWQNALPEEFAERGRNYE